MTAAGDDAAEGAPSAGSPAPAAPAPEQSASPDPSASVPAGGGEVTIDLDVTAATPDLAAAVAAETETTGVVGDEMPADSAVTAEAATGDDPVAAEATEAGPADGAAGGHDEIGDDVGGGEEVDAGGAPVYAELETLRGDLGELTRDLQRVSAEYANYRKRVDRDRLLVGEQATGAVLTALLPVLDDLDRARNHGDLVGPFAAVAEQLGAAMQKFGLAPFGESGDPFDPTVHEAVAHMSSADVTETTCVEVMRRGYMLGDRLLRPALVAVADPE